MSDAKIYFSWKSIMPDKRQYKQNGTVLEPQDVNVVVDVPICAAFLDNWEELINVSAPIADITPSQLTPAGMRYCIDQLEAVLSEPTESMDTPEGNTDSWDDEPKKTSSKRDDDWGAQFDEEPKESIEEEPFEDNEENWK